MIYGVHDLVRAFSRPVVEMAKAQVEQGVVDIMPVPPGATRVFGTVRSHGPTVRVTARADIREHGLLELSGDCSCRSHRDCEHVAAVLLSALGPEALREADGPRSVHPVSSRVIRPAVPLEEPADVREARAVAEWLHRVVSAADHRGERADRKPEKHRVLYVLGLQAEGRRLTVHPVLAYVRKDGRFGSTKTCGWTGCGNRPAYLTVEDRELLPAILGYAHGSWPHQSFHHPVAIDTDAGARLLERLLATGRCHWRDTHASALRLGEARTARIEWTLDPEGKQRPRFVVDGSPDALGLGVEPPWYVNPTESVAGPLELDIETRTAVALLEAPSLSPESAARAREILTTTAARCRLPLPVPLSVEIREHSPKPVPHLRLHMWRPNVGPAWATPDIASAPMLNLTFDYDGVRVRANDEEQVVQRVVDGELVRIGRDVEFEDTAVEHLVSMGFIPLSDELPFADPENEAAGEFLPDVDPEHLPGFLVEFGRVVVPQLRKDGWVVETDDDYAFRVIEGEAEWYADLGDGPNHWFNLELGVEIDGQRLSLLPILVKMLRDPRVNLREQDLSALPDGGKLALRTEDGRVLVLPAERVRAILGTLTELFGDQALSDKGALPLSVWNAPRLAELDETLSGEALRWSGGEQMRELGRKLRDFGGMQEVAVPSGFCGTLRPYQRQGLNWLQFLREHNLAGVLADDMGLGKTVQVLAHLLVEKRAGRMDRPSLVVAPTSVVTNWSREAETFAPDLRVLILRGQSRSAHFDRLAEHDLILTTYPLLSRDEDALLRQPYHALILDEAQFVKNAKTKAAAVARRIEARHRLCLTGTPMENHLGELWSLFHILMPGLLGDAKQFRKLFRTPIEKHDDRSRREQLAARVRPFLMRRTKNEVAAELPPKTEMTRSIELERAQRDLYESIRLAMNDRVRKEIARKGLARSTIIILDALLKLRQVCCDPRLLKIKEARRAQVSAKLDALMEMLGEMLEEGRRILLFSQFTSMIKLIEDELRKREVSWVRITGQTRDRDTPVRRFQQGEVPLFLISLKAGGTGLNLTAADTVIHYDPWWNPAVEDQATDRAHRIGQDKPVFVYRLIVAGSVEEKMLALQARKRDLADSVYGTRAAKGRSPLSPEDLEVLFRPLE